MHYFRIHVHYNGSTGKPLGIFSACHHLRRAGALTQEDARLFEEIDNWYKEHLPEPPFYKDGNPRKAIMWFKDTPAARELVGKLDVLTALLDKYRVAHETSWTDDPGEIIYEDEYQVAVV
jgi:hypothetical protein